jgi:hypothetical protein
MLFLSEEKLEAKTEVVRKMHMQEIIKKLRKDANNKQTSAFCLKED